MVDLGGGVRVEHDVLNIVEKLREYDENLIVQMLDPARADAITDAPFRIMELCPDGLARPVLDVWTLDETVLERIYAADNRKFDTLWMLDQNNNKARRYEEQEFEDKTAALSDMVQGVLRSPKDTYRATNPVTGEEHTFRSMRRSD
jgi:hypothetical protein